MTTAADDADRQLFENELRRCEILSTQVEAPCPPGPVATTNDARYYAERGRVLRKMGRDRAVAFLREEALAALSGGPRLGKVSRWFVLARLDKFGDVTPSYEALARSTITDLLADGVTQMNPKVLQVVITSAWERHHGKSLCPECAGVDCGNEGCLT